MPKAKTRKKKTSIYIEASLLDALQRISDVSMISKANLIRLGIKNIIKEWQMKLRLPPYDQVKGPLSPYLHASEDKPKKRK